MSLSLTSAIWEDGKTRGFISDGWYWKKDTGRRTEE